MRGEARGHDFVDDEEGAEVRCCGAEVLEEGWVAGDAAAGALHGLDEDGGEGVRGQGGEDGRGGGDVVVGCYQEGVREVSGELGVVGRG